MKMVTKKVSVSAHGYLFYHRTNDADCVSKKLYGSGVGKWKREKRRVQLTLFEALDRHDRDQAAEAAWRLFGEDVQLHWQEYE